MRRYNESFKLLLAGIDFETMENSSHTIFGLSKDLKLIYFNQAWFEFAKQNNGEPNISLLYPIGASFENGISGEIKTFYIENYIKVLSDLKVWKHEYECSSPELYRLYCQDVYPLKNGEGIIVINSLKVEIPHDKKDKNKSVLAIKKYVNYNGFITQCTNCRKTQRPNEPENWDWIPNFVSKPPKNVSHSICSICYDYFWKF